MGSGFSSFLVLSSAPSAPAVPPETNLGDLPESVVGSVLVHLNPQEICRLAALNRAFRGASSADFVWESKLPENYDSIVSRVFGDGNEFPSNLCKRDIYARLSRPNSIDGGTKVRDQYVCLQLELNKHQILTHNLFNQIFNHLNKILFSWFMINKMF